MKPLSALLLFLSVVAGASAQSTAPVYGQCGGENYSGPTTCAAGSACVFQNPYYSQCIPGATSSAPPPSSSTTTVSKTSSTTSVPSPTATVSGFVKTSGKQFTLNGKPFTVVGANSYWVGLMNYGTSDMNKAFADIAATGATTVRTWGFNEVTTPDGVAYYQSWSGKTPTVNTGANGLQNFDKVVAAAKANGLRLIVTLTNNWSDYGGMDVYVNQLLGQGSAHDFFYTNSAVISAFQNYVRTFVSRYVNEPGILGWELANEPRCTGSTSASSGTCTTATITNWATQMSAFIKGIDSNHLVAIGDEGFFNEPGNSNFLYQCMLVYKEVRRRRTNRYGTRGTLGIDFSANLNIKTIDFGTFHLYPDSWGQARNPFGQQWITDHATSMTASNKPVIMEEFGVTSDQSDIYSTWYSTVLSSGISGDLIWQAGSVLSTSTTPNDGYAIYPGTDVYTLDTQHAAALKARNGG